MDKKPILKVKAEFSPLMVGLQVFGIGISSALFVAGGIDIFFLVISAIFGIGLGFGSMFMLVFLICGILFPAALYEIKRKNYNNTYFKFFDDYIDFSYFSGALMNKRQGRLYYKDIEDILQYSNFFQNFVGLETIQLYAPNTRFYDRQKNFIGIEIPDIKTSKHVGQKIQKILDRWHEKNTVAIPAEPMVNDLVETEVIEEQIPPSRRRDSSDINKKVENKAVKSEAKTTEEAKPEEKIAPEEKPNKAKIDNEKDVGNDKETEEKSDKAKAEAKK